MTTPTADQLQSLWTTPPPLATPPIRPTLRPQPRCWHRDRSVWIDRPDRIRTGWIRTTCRLCGGFIGYRTGHVS
ncbi:MAG: hypothetical protein F9B45_14825 [Phycisphaera sp. RhM]|nr:hypothetical protein [Phycisphaera sp. RhM]